MKTLTSKTSFNVPEDQMLNFVDVGEAMQKALPPPEMLIEGLLYVNGIHILYSPGGTGKTIIALWMAVKAMEDGVDVIYIDEENGRYHVVELLQHLGADSELVGEHFHYAESPGLTKDDEGTWVRTVERVQPGLVVFDSLADHLALDNLNENSSVDVTGWVKRSAQPVKNIGSAVLILDHVGHDKAKGARGSTAKLAKADVTWQLACTKSFDRNTVGSVTITKDKKDRMGALYQSHKFKVGGVGSGRLVVTQVGVETEPKPKTLKGNEKVAYDALAAMPDGARAGEWQKASGIPPATFYRVIPNLTANYVHKNDDTGYYHALPQDSQEHDGSGLENTLAHSHTL